MTELERLASVLVGFDLETDLVVLGLLVPPIVCGSTANAIRPDGDILAPRAALDTFRTLCRGDFIITGANIAYDSACVAAEAYRDSVEKGDEVLAEIFKKYDKDEVFDVLIAEGLHAIAGGHLGKDPTTGMDLKDPATGRRARYSLSVCAYLNLGIIDAKVNDFWRLRYGILKGLPFEKWPEVALQYPKDDARNTRNTALAQIKTHRNLHDMGRHVKAAFALQLASAHGMRTNPAKVAKLENDVTESRAAEAGRWRFLGFLDADDGDKRQGRVIKERMARAFGARSPCRICGGSGKIRNAAGKVDVICGVKNWRGSADRSRFENPDELMPCDGSGLDLADAPMLTRTDTGNIAAGRDLLAESGDEDLIDFAEYQEDDKLVSVYLPFLKKAVAQPVNVRANILLANGRTSYEDVIQLLPRDGGIRPCFEPRPGFFYSSADYASGEMVTFAQVLLLIVGWSRMADVINATEDPGALHADFAGKLLGCTADEVKARIKAGDETAKKFRQGAKPANFGFPGGMGVVRFVLSKRKKSEGTTTGPDGKKYVGIRFCILLGDAPRCGEVMVTEWGKKNPRPNPPVCRKCVEVAEHVKAEWLRCYPEVPKYFDWVSANVDATGELTQLFSERVRGGLSFCDGANTMFSGLLADGAKDALWEITKECYVDQGSPLFGSRPIIFLHDETMLEVPEDIAHEAATRQAELMVEGLKKYCPDVHVACSPALMRAWHKGAEPIYLDGKLKPWTPKEHGA